MLVRNKWNKKTYKVLEIKDSSVVLQREDGSQFEIAKSEYFSAIQKKVLDKLNSV